MSLTVKKIFVIVRKNMKIYYLKAPIIIFGIIFPFFLFLAFSIGRDVSVAYLFPGIISITMFFSSSSIGPAIPPWETNMKTLERILSTPISITSVVFGDIISGFLYGFALTIVPFLLSIFYTALQSYAVVLLAIILGSFCFSSLGTLISTYPTDTPSTSMMISSLVRFPIIFISGVFISVNDLPAAGKYISFISPLTYIVDIIRFSFGQKNFMAIWIDFLVVFLFTILFIISSLLLHKKFLPRRL
ncbi:MAG: ABC transporter permease [Actinobacteria bacterium]|nr:ABC transporter permease [Actinomycetota bacterium]